MKTLKDFLVIVYTKRWIDIYADKIKPGFRHRSNGIDTNGKKSGFTLNDLTEINRGIEAYKNDLTQVQESIQEQIKTLTNGKSF